MKSILQDNKECYVTGITQGLHRHHIFYGISNRKLSEKYGLWVWLCGRLHNLSSEGVHFNKPLDRWLKKEAQKKAMERYGWSEEDFIKIFGRNYLC